MRISTIKIQAKFKPIQAQGVYIVRASYRFSNCVAAQSVHVVLWILTGL